MKGNGFMRSAWPSLVLATLLLGPFAGKAFTIDDTLFLRQAEHLLVDPLHPTAFEMVWSGLGGAKRLSSFMPSGPVMAYLLLPVVKLGGAEWAAHLVQWLLLVAALLGTVSLGVRLGLGPAAACWAALLLAATPAVLGMAGTAMPDVAVMAFVVLAMDRLVAWRDGGHAASGLLLALLSALALLARSHVVFLLPVTALALVERADLRRPSLWAKRLWPLAGGLALALLGLYVTRDPQSGAAAIGGAAENLATLRYLDSNLLAFFTHWMLVLPLALPWLVLRGRRLPWKMAPVLFLGMAGLVASMRHWPHPGRVEAPLWVAPVATASALVLVDILGEARRRGGAGDLLLAGWLLVALPVVFYIHTPSKYLIVSAPAAALLVARQASERPRLLTATVLAGCLLGLLILRGDQLFAGIGRRGAEAFITPAVKQGRTVWFVGHWGFQWYAERAGARFLGRSPPHPARGDLVVISFATAQPLAHPLPEEKRRVLGELGQPRPCGRTMSYDDNAGFFSNVWGFLPWAWGTGYVDLVQLWEVL